MTVQITLPPEAEAKLKERATASGQDVSSYASRLLQEVISSPTVEEALAPFRKQVAESGLTDAELDAFFEELRNRTWQQARADSVDRA